MTEPKPFLEWMDELIDKRIDEMTPSEFRTFQHEFRTFQHRCDRCPHDLTVIDGVPIADLSDEDLLFEYGSEREGESRSISTDSPRPTENLRQEILRRMSANKHNIRSSEELAKLWTDRRPSE